MRKVAKTVRRNTGQASRFRWPVCMVVAGDANFSEAMGLKVGELTANGELLNAKVAAASSSKFQRLTQRLERTWSFGRSFKSGGAHQSGQLVRKLKQALDCSGLTWLNWLASISS